MLAFRTTQAVAGRQAGSRPPVEGRTAKAAYPTATTSIELIVDSRGSIVECSDALMTSIGIPKEQIFGKNVRSFIPALPFQAETEGYNIAYATFLAARKDATTWSIVLTDGRRFNAEGRIAIQRTFDAYAICVSLAPTLPHLRSLHDENRAPGWPTRIEPATSRAHLMLARPYRNGRSHARHANGQLVPATIDLNEGRHDYRIALESELAVD